MNPPSEDIKDILEADSGLALTFADNLHIGQMPETPDLCVCIYDEPGFPIEPTEVTYERPRILIKARGARNGYKAAHELAQQVRDAVHTIVNETINGARYIAVWNQADVGSVGQDQNSRPQLTCSFLIHRTTA